MNSKTHIETETVDELKKIIDAQSTMIDSLLSKEQGYQSEIAILKEQIRALQDMMFGRKSEKRVVDDGQLSLFESSEEVPTPVAVSEEVHEISIGAHKRKKGGRQAIPENLPRIEVIHDLVMLKNSASVVHKNLHRSGELRQLDIIPAKVQVIRNIRLKYACSLGRS